ncbi:MAG: Ig-like domain-containing protein, partial [Methanobacterium paludis]|nr:Ig-like domain-containing protein [Methanobacterium paludis]
LTGNTANYGGAIYSGYNSFNVTGNALNNNTASINGGAIYNYYSDVNPVVNFNQIVGNSPNTSAIYSKTGTVDATLNWWGSNDNPSGNVNNNVNVTSWLILSITADPTSILNGSNSTVTVDLLHANNETIQDPTNGHVPDGILINFTGTLGTLNSSTLQNGQATSIFTAKSAGTGSITATINNYSVSTPITVRTPPTVTVIDPANNTVNVAINKVIKVTFNEPIKAGTGWIELVKNNDTSVSIPITWNISGNVLTVTTNSTLAHGVGYRLLIHTGSITNLASDNVAAYVSRFTTSSDVTAPTVKTVDPANNAVNIAADKVIKVTFKEAITEGTGWIELTTSNGTIVPSTFSISGNVLT